MNRLAFGTRFARDFLVNKYLYLMMVPVIAYYAVFHYAPMYGVLIAFKEYSPIKGIMDSPWGGFSTFQRFFRQLLFFESVEEYGAYNLYSLIFEFPAPIILALMINEIRSKRYKKLVQTVTYMPYFISMIVIAGLIRDFTDSGGVIIRFTRILEGMEPPCCSIPDYSGRSIYYRKYGRR